MFRMIGNDSHHVLVLVDLLLLAQVQGSTVSAVDKELSPGLMMVMLLQADGLLLLLLVRLVVIREVSATFCSFVGSEKRLER